MRFTQEHELLRQSIKRLIETEIAPHVDTWEEAGIFPAHELFPKLGRAGILGITKPVEYGGQGLDYSFSLVYAEEIGRIRCSGLSTAIGVQTDMATPALARYGSEALKQEFLVPAICGERVASIAVSEVGAGSDVASINTHARRDGGDYVINGSKMWITNGTQSDWLCLLCNTGTDNAPHHNKSLIVVPTDTQGVTRGKRLNKLGARSSDTAPIFLDEVRVPRRFLIGEEGQGFIYQMQQFQEERLFAGSKYLSQIEDAIDITAEYTATRMVFGKPLLDQQIIHCKLAELKAECCAARALLREAAEHYIAGDADAAMLVSMAKFKVGQLGQAVPSACLQFWGGQGFMWDNLISRIFRDTRLCSIGGGANEVMLQIIAKDLGFHPAARKAARAKSQH
ncbi:acyl-CoA dehydrogenase family protein [Algiphilus sp. W345]|uniref:Acyl-CoA dehydrogenase family protein n=1 Tax=Banduia mediterranea TaxID=3075609 RepID=A0ABU2WEX8_9GAMM|nr:acyl-CoA dehydrogenase family protein [Algiphilus sp. W345]MDT0496406.1 acyl-CoA dehydrogenase family protein [Algiphilus sp. W345]